jgi:hypothetical protein
MFKVDSSRLAGSVFFAQCKNPSLGWDRKLQIKGENIGNERK